ncbi:helix-turn-helix domain-containing protein [Psychroserpens mesophilus]|uniref:helix-turn-helix domain-containing protein n=1 Tax=Psychroserpens mesophilus TaxID=325473 RepID=UPI0005908701|nr:XRE family transcriptional regulator [Psychroserpens mesophilus]
MSKSRPHINPEVLIWAREQLNAEPELIARRVGTSLAMYTAWENGESLPSHKQLQKLSIQLQVPATAFYLKNTPIGDNSRLEMRRLPGYTSEEDSFQFSKQVNECIKRRKIISELIERMEIEFPTFNFKSSINNSPSDVANEFREFLNINISEQLRYRGKFEALKNWRQTLEKHGILVFQLERVDLNEARGFALYKDFLPIVTINSNDSVGGRIFTLFHEVGHLLLGESIVHNHLDYDSSNEIEIWCNKFSAHFLVPTNDLIATCKTIGTINSSAKVDRLIKRYWVSGSALLRRLKEQNLISNEDFRELTEIYDSFRAEKGSGGDYYRNVVARMGTLLPDLAFDSYYSNAISIRDLSSILNMKMSNLKEFEKRFKGSEYAFGN